MCGVYVFSGVCARGVPYNRTFLQGAMNKNFLFLTGAIASEVVATSALKASDGMTRLPAAAVVVVGYALSFWLLSLALRSIPVGVAYAIWSGVGMTLVALVGWLLYGQRLDTWALAGMGCIVAGVVMLTLLSRSGSA